MDYIDFNQADGFPLSSNILDFFQESQQFLQTIAEGFGSLNSVGDAIAIYGCVNNGVSISDGILYVYTPGGKELLPFVGGTLETYYMISETITQKEFFDGDCKDVLYDRSCTLTSGTTTYLVNQIQTIRTNRQLESDIETINTTVSGITTVQNNLPLGTIVMWSNYNQIGTTPIVPTGWSLCDGKNGTPNLSGKFIVGYHASDSDYEDLHITGGTKEVTLTSDQSGVADHSHSGEGGRGILQGTLTRIGEEYEGALSDANLYGIRYDTGSVLLGDTASTSANASLAHENRPPYYVLAYIMKTSYI